ncbi:hypothetical protein NDU88_005681 [Pleurodeles waltl]|uniref:Uncharacterized protein n=1 Tax=Pleurodeles waltl TaxID=8319 RepID=A0AAV7L1J9_PLEWA|nr:hypothetical protein NDU88_005681 [Pleurodeles waltl]
MCLPETSDGSEQAPLRSAEKAAGGVFRHWNRATLELRRARRGSARIPLRRNTSRVSTSKVADEKTEEAGAAIPEGVEGRNLKSYVASLIKSAVGLEETKEEIEKDIQRVHRNPFTRRPNSSKPRRIFINFLTYELK